MRFNAIVHAPVLRAGTRLNIAEADQREDVSPHRLALGDEVALRFGVCCPDRSDGRIVAATPRPESVTLTIGDRSWTLFRNGQGGVTTPGLVSEDWFVAGADGAPRD